MFKRINFGEKNGNWKGDMASDNAGRERARYKYPSLPCLICGNKKSEIHHVDGNPLNNSPENIRFLCREHHMESDGRKVKLINRNKNNVRKPNWNKGLTSKEDKRILGGKRHPLYGKQLSEETKKKISKIRIEKDYSKERSPVWKGDAASPHAKYMRLWKQKRKAGEN